MKTTTAAIRVGDCFHMTVEGDQAFVTAILDNGYVRAPDVEFTTVRGRFALAIDAANEAVRLGALRFLSNGPIVRPVRGPGFYSPRLLGF